MMRDKISSDLYLDQLVLFKNSNKGDLSKFIYSKIFQLFTAGKTGKNMIRITEMLEEKGLLTKEISNYVFNLNGTSHDPLGITDFIIRPEFLSKLSEYYDGDINNIITKNILQRIGFYNASLNFSKGTSYATTGPNYYDVEKLVSGFLKQPDFSLEDYIEKFIDADEDRWRSIRKTYKTDKLKEKYKYFSEAGKLGLF